MSDKTNFKENKLTERKQCKRNKISYYTSNSKTLYNLLFNNCLFSHIQSLIMFFLVFCINSESLQILFAQKTQRPSVNGED
jgi:hypothetical protein